MIAVDSSAIIALLLREPNAKQVLDALLDADALVAPARLPYEVLNALRAAAKVELGEVRPKRGPR